MHISVVTVAFNAEATIAATLRSLGSQTMRVEHVIIDGGSSDATLDIVRSLAPDAIVVSEKDRGLYDAMNKGVTRATGDYVAFLNADDVYARPDALEIVQNRLAATAADILCGGVVMVRDSAPDRIVRNYRATGFKPWQFRFGHMPPHPGSFVRRSLLEEAPFRIDLGIASDFAQLLQLSQRPELRWVTIAQTLVAMRIGGLSTGGFSTNARINREISQVLQDHGVYTNRALVWSKYLGKVSQFIGRPADLPRGWRAAF